MGSWQMTSRNNESKRLPVIQVDEHLEKWYNLPGKAI